MSAFKARPHRGQLKSRGKTCRRVLEGSQIRESHRDCGKVQDAYSLRCIPQVHGAARDALRRIAAASSKSEVNSAVDNRDKTGLRQRRQAS